MKQLNELDGHTAAVCPGARRCLHHAKTSHSASHPHNKLHASALHFHIPPGAVEPTNTRLVIFGLAQSNLLLVLARTLR